MSGFRGVKKDLSEIALYLRKIMCLAAPHQRDSPPPSPHLSPPTPLCSPPSRVLARISDDLPEIGESFNTSIYRPSTVQKDPSIEDREGVDVSRDSRVVGVTDEILEFVEDLVNRPELWAESPLPSDDNFDMSPSQMEHIAAIERLVPSLAALRISLCPNGMSEKSFWKIYFSRLHPRLNKHDSQILSTNQIVEEMHIVMANMQNRMNTQLQSSSEMSTSIDASEQFRSEDVSFTDLKDDDNGVVLIEAAQVPSYSSNKWVRSRKKISSIGGPSNATPHEKNILDKESSDWHTVNDFDLEIVEDHFSDKIT